jgi:hypothetical protein
MPTYAAGELIPEAAPAHSGDAMPTWAFSAIMEATAPTPERPRLGSGLDHQVGDPEQRRDALLGMRGSRCVRRSAAGTPA